MFKRRKEHNFLTKIREFLWPKMGWKRFFQYYWNRIVRSATPYQVSMGLACGVWASFTPFLGLHFILAGILAWIFRGSILASAVGTFVGNPWTFPLIWIASISFGDYVLGSDNFSKANFTSWEKIIDSIADLFYPMLIGGAMLGALISMFLFVIFYIIIKLYSNYSKNDNITK